MGSINQNANASALPNFRNLGILLPILVIVDGACLAAALFKTSEALPLMEELIDLSAAVQPTLLASLLVFAAMNNWLRRLAYWPASAAVIAIDLGLVTTVYFLGRGFERVTGADGESQWAVLLNGLQEKLVVSRLQQDIVREFGKHLK